MVRDNLRLATSAALLSVLVGCSQNPTDGSDICERTADMPQGYRLEYYRRPTPACVPGATTVSTAEVRAMLEGGNPPLLIDVWAILLRSEPGFGHEWLPNEQHMSLPGAVWLPNVGYGRPDPIILRWFDDKLAQLTSGNTSQPLVFFCVADCWMSWNASIRAQTMGYSEIYWYRNGTSGWLEAGYTLTPLDPATIDYE